MQRYNNYEKKRVVTRVRVPLTPPGNDELHRFLVVTICLLAKTVSSKLAAEERETCSRRGRSSGVCILAVVRAASFCTKCGSPVLLRHRRQQARALGTFGKGLCFLRAVSFSSWELSRSSALRQQELLCSGVFQLHSTAHCRGPDVLLVEPGRHSNPRGLGRRLFALRCGWWVVLPFRCPCSHATFKGLGLY